MGGPNRILSIGGGRAALRSRKAVHQLNAKPDEIACIGFSGQCTVPVMLDEAGTSFAPPSSGATKRTEKQCTDLEQTFGLAHIIQLTCNPPLTNFTLTKLLWVRDNEPKNWARIRHVMSLRTIFAIA